MQSRLEDALAELDALRKVDCTRDLAPHIEVLLRQAWSDEDAIELRHQLIGELQCHGRHREAETLLLAEVARDPADPYHSVSLAEHFHYYDINLPRSLEHVAQAITKAKAVGEFMYQALGVQARLAIEAQNWVLLESTLLELASYEHKPGNIDVFPETDFIKRIPVGLSSTPALIAYKNRLDHLRSINYSTIYGARQK
ncbi:MAG: hypothetical protein IPP44_24995 [Ideonella sp.]|nr:hypothetical protein [Ideonella sp.]